ncbi:hypothetical protein [Borreliella valaisiana]|uniref:hypothetical protein n=1 Tax=Borreliella valaisiana TaxID=62088 RepID=UPI002ED57FF5|nr:hypothetical protein KJD09_05005 [Borreliella valaisiana]
MEINHSKKNFMEKSISILNVFFFISFFCSCVLELTSSKNIKTEVLDLELIKGNN